MWEIQISFDMHPLRVIAYIIAMVTLFVLNYQLWCWRKATPNIKLAYVSASLMLLMGAIGEHPVRNMIFFGILYVIIILFTKSVLNDIKELDPSRLLKKKKKNRGQLFDVLDEDSVKEA